ncbi:hypothetical protein N9937_00900 [bacterium]|nr:hypothetical protein [bacterium]
MDRVFKKIHDDGSETVIKHVRPTSRNEHGDIVTRFTPVTSIFISSSKGCPKKCVFCHLTEMGMEFKRLSDIDIVLNVMNAVQECEFVDFSTEFKLCFMGMGDPMIHPDTTCGVVESLSIALDVIEVDISTIIPRDDGIDMIWRRIVNRLKIPTRLFYSLHAGKGTRNLIIPKAQLRGRDSVALENWSNSNPLFIHYTPVAGLNDGLLDAMEIAEFAKRYGADQVRMLEYNPYPDSLFERPSEEQLRGLYRLFQKYEVDVKWQVSKGKNEVAACGMFNNPMEQ